MNANEKFELKIRKFYAEDNSIQFNSSLYLNVNQILEINRDSYVKHYQGIAN